MRQVIKLADIQGFFGCQKRMGSKKMMQIKKKYHKQSNQPVTVREFCEFYKVAEEEIRKIMAMVDENVKQYEKNKTDRKKLEETLILINNSNKQPYHFSTPNRQ